MTRLSGGDGTARSAILCAMAMIAQQVAGKAARDALFFSSFTVGALPTMLVSAALVSILFVALAARVMAAVGPRRLVPFAFATSGVLLLVVWAGAGVAPRVAAAVLYLQIASFGPVVTSAFWSLVGERFDPRTARRRLGRIAGAGTLGGVLGGIAAERMSALATPIAVLPMLAGLHLACAVLSSRFASAGGPAAESSPATGPGAPSLLSPGGLLADPYVRHLAAFVLVGSTAAVLADSLFKMQAAARFSGSELLRVFALYYTASGVLAFLIQVAAGRASLERIGLARTAALLPASVLIAAAGNLLVPGLGAAAGLRGVESVVRGSLYRLAYELLYTPLPMSRRRAVKTVVDVGVDRLGDIVGGGLVRLVLALGPAGASAMAALVAVLAAVGLRLAWALHRGYVAALEQGLMSRALELDLAAAVDPVTRSVLLASGEARVAPEGTAASANLAAPVLGAADILDTGLFLMPLALPRGARAGPPSEPASPAAPSLRRDPTVARLLDLRSGEAARVRQALGAGPLDPSLVPQALRLLAWDDVYGDALVALRGVAPRAVGQIEDALLDPDEEFAVRRRAPRALAHAPSARSVQALLRGLADARFEVRFTCGRALAALRQKDPGLPLDPAEVFQAIVRETSSDGLWNRHELLDEALDPALSAEEPSPGPGGLSVEHVFTLLSLALPPQPVRVAFRGLHSHDAVLRGLALEYLESVLPAAVRLSLLPHLEAEETVRNPPRPHQQVVEDLMRSSAALELGLRRGGKRPATPGEGPS